MPFYFQHADHKVNLEDLPLDRWIKIEEACGLQWPEILTGKCIGDARVAKVVIEHAAEHLGIPVPPLTLKAVVELITYAPEETTPEQFVDGIPDPKAGDSEPAAI